MNITIQEISTLQGNKFSERFTLTLPLYADVLSVHRSDKTNHPMLVVMMDLDQTETEERTFELYPTGATGMFNDDVERKYVGTYQYQNGEFVGHVFEVLDKA
jgi:hypothetical protein